MTQGEIEDYVRKVINTYLADDDYMVDRVVAEITYRWMNAQDDAFTRGQHAVIDSMR